MGDKQSNLVKFVVAFFFPVSNLEKNGEFREKSSNP
jgi:hypothetical protein